MSNPTESVPTDGSLIKIPRAGDGNPKPGEPVSSSTIVAKGWPTLNSGVLQPDTTDERNTDLRVCVSSLTAIMDRLNTLDPAVSIRELESAGVLSTYSTCIFNLIHEGLGKDERGSS